MSYKFSAMILAAGFGKRMLPLTENLPKPLIDIKGITLLDNSINFLKKLGCNQIIINTHYKHEQIQQSLNKRIHKDDITLVYENKILDTGGGLKNATPFFNNNNILILNSDIFLIEENLLDIQSLINNYYINNYQASLLLVDKKNAYGLIKKKGDFILKNNNIFRYTKGNKIIFYSGLQILNIKILKEFSLKKFSLNIVWDTLINQQKLFGQMMQTNLYHVGDIHGLNIVRELDS